jgi:hypothetical protein
MLVEACHGARAGVRVARGAPLPWLRCVTTITCAYLGQSCPYGGMTPLLGVAPSEKVIGLPKVSGVGVEVY